MRSFRPAPHADAIETSNALNRPDGLRTVGPRTLSQPEARTRDGLTSRKPRGVECYRRDWQRIRVTSWQHRLYPPEQAKAVAVPYRPQRCQGARGPGRSVRTPEANCAEGDPRLGTPRSSWSVRASLSWVPNWPVGTRCCGLSVRARGGDAQARRARSAGSSTARARFQLVVCLVCRRTSDHTKRKIVVARRIASWLFLRSASSGSGLRRADYEHFVAERWDFISKPRNRGFISARPRRLQLGCRR
jgi:hypothetical protein